MTVFMASKRRHVANPFRAALIAAALVAGALITVPSVDACATATTNHLQSARKAFASGDYKAAYEAADAGIKAKPTQALYLCKARSALKLGQVSEAWEYFQKIQPGELSSEDQEVFVPEYATAEEAFNKDRQVKANAKALEAKQAREDAASKRRMLLIAGGVGIVSGGVLVYLGLDMATTAEALDLTKPGSADKYTADRDTADLVYGGGLGLAAIGAGLAAWGLLHSSPADAPSSALFVTPRFGRDGHGTGLMVSGRF